MASNFNKEERVMFDNAVGKFEDGEILAKAVRKSDLTADAQMMERANNVLWRRQPYTVVANTSQDQTGLFNGITQLSVPLTLSYRAAFPMSLTQNELRDPNQLKWASDAAVDAIGAKINSSITDAICLQGSVVIKQTTAPTGFNDLALANARLNQRGCVNARRVAGIDPEAYRLMASDLAQRQVLQAGKTLTAYEEAMIGKIAGFDTLALPYTKSLAAKTATGVTLTTAAGSNWVPKATSTAASGETSNVDNRFQTIGVTVTSGTLAVGDCFTIANIYSVHNTTKQSTGQLMTFRVSAIVTGGGGTGTIQITPPIINNAGATTAELQYQNCTGALANGAVITLLNTVSGNVLPFFDERAVELLPGKLPMSNEGGMNQLSYTTKSGMNIVLSKQADINTRSFKYVWETFYGVGILNTEMCGIILFNQT